MAERWTFAAAWHQGTQCLVRNPVALIQTRCVCWVWCNSFSCLFFSNHSWVSWLQHPPRNMQMTAAAPFTQSTWQILYNHLHCCWSGSPLLRSVITLIFSPPKGISLLLLPQGCLGIWPKIAPNSSALVRFGMRPMDSHRTYLSPREISSHSRIARQKSPEVFRLLQGTIIHMPVLDRAKVSQQVVEPWHWCMPRLLGNLLWDWTGNWG